MLDDRSPASSFRHPLFRTLWIASAFYNLGAMVQTVGAAWLMTSIAASLQQVTLVQTASNLPLMLFSLLAGALADLFSRRSIMLLAQTMMLAASAALAGFTYFDLVTPWIILALLFVIGCGTALHNPAWQASTGDIVPRDNLAGAITLNSMGLNAARTIGPALGGLIVAFAGVIGAFMVTTMSYVPLVVMLQRWTARATPGRLPREPLLHAMAAGLRYVAMSPPISRVILRSSLYGFAVIATYALLPIVARDFLGGGARLYGILFGCVGIGAIAGGYGFGFARRRLDAESMVRGGFLAGACSLCVVR